MKKGGRMVFWPVLGLILIASIAGMMFHADLREIKRYPLRIQGKGFEVSVDLPCNRFHAMEVGFEVHPPLPLERVEHAGQAITGQVSLTFADGDVQQVDLSRTTSFVDGRKGIWLKTLWRRPAQWRWACSQTPLVIKANDLSLDLSKHALTVYVSRDRRD